MATGTYGTIRPADVSPEDVSIIMNYTPSRDVTDDFLLTSLDAAAILRPYFNNASTGGNTNEILGGLYNLRLPADVFTQIGIYTLYIRPAEIRTTITDCGVLSALPNVKGIVIDLSNVPSQYVNKFVAQGLVGFRVEYLNASSSPTNKPNATPYIGQPAQSIILSNTYFNPLTLEVQVSQYDIDTLGIALYGNQTKSMEDGIYTIYDAQNNIYQQYNLYEIKDDFNNLLYEVKDNRGTNIDFSKSYQNITAQ